MASYTRLGSFLVSDLLATVPAGKIHRALSTAGSSWERHYLLCLFSDELLEAGLASRWPEAQRIADQLAGARGFGGTCRFEPGSPAHMSCDYIPGRTLAQVLARTREEQIPLGVDHALTVLQGLAQAIILMHDRNLHHGTLSPHSAWVAYEGATHLLDAPVAGLVQALLPKAPALRAALEPYRPSAPASAFQQDLFALGALLYEMLTLEQLPAGPAIPDALAQATLKAAQEDEAIPGEILAFLKRLLMVGEPFPTPAAFSADLERVLYDGEYSPTTFNMAFLMHTLFREENEADGEAARNEQGANYAQYLPPGSGAPVPQAAPAAGKSSRSTLYLVAAGVVAAGLFAYYQINLNRQHQIEQKSLQDKLAELQKEKEANDAKLADIAKQEEAQKTLADMFGRQAEEGGTAEARDTARKDLEAAQQKARDLAKERVEALKEKQQLLAKQNAAQVWNKAAAAQAAAAFNAAAGAAPAPVAPAASELPTIAQKGTPQQPRIAVPPALQQSDIRVALKVFVDAAGRPMKAVITRGVEGDYGYNEAAQNAALASTFVPGKKDGKAVSGWLEMEFDFGKPR
jgi:hypothetical protein